MTSLRKRKSAAKRALLGRRMHSRIEDVPWDRMQPVGREFGSPDFERLMEEDRLNGRGIFDPSLKDILRVELAAQQDVPMQRTSASEIHAANERAAERLRAGPVALAARCDVEAGVLLVQLVDGMTCSIRLDSLPWLQAATAHDLAEVEVSPAGLGIYFPTLDVDLYLPDLISQGLHQGTALMYTVLWSVEDSAFVGLCGAFPSLSWCADSHQAAFDGIRRLVDEVVVDLLASGQPLPPFFSQQTGNG